MEPRKYALADLFDGHLVYVVPNYQRLYVWSQEGQWDPLWLDVVDIANNLIADARRRNSDEVNSESTESHFLGAVVLKISGSTPDLARKYRVIDGQQRLTTLQLLVAAAVTELESEGLVSPADRLRQLIANSSSAASSGIDSFKINHHRHTRGHDYERFDDVMRAALNGGAVDTIDGPMAKCYRFFREAIRNWISSREAGIKTVATALATTLIMKLHVVGIYLDSHEKEHIIFETLNARGEPLTEWDKIKNYLLYKADEEPGLSQESFFEEYLDRFDYRWWRQAVGRGAAQRPRSDIFVDYWLESRKNTHVSARRVFREFQKYVDDEDHTLDHLMIELIQDARYFKRYAEYDSSENSREALFHRRRLGMAIGAIWPLLLKLQRINADPSKREQWLASLESYFVRRKIVGYQARSYDRVSLELMNSLLTATTNQSDVGEAILSHLIAYKEVATLWPNDAEVRNAVLNGHHSRHTRLMLLSAIEQHLIPEFAAVPTFSPSVQIEHLMPSGWQQESWPLPDSSDPTTAVEERNSALKTLGNLTLLNGRLNASISNGPWSQKRAAIQESDNLFLNRHLLENSGDEWMERDIARRGEWMYSIIVEIWPRG